ncbi:PEP-CTERM sorting domain-containing protein [Pseudodesulfovibrio cashew]|nr:PEP-CTERM sorting domain-containing protein [Pseudodesulfovibrio cashew]
MAFLKSTPMVICSSFVLLLLISPVSTSHAAPIYIDFDSLSSGAIVSDQYGALGVFFQNSLTDTASDVEILDGGYDSTINAIMTTSYSDGFYVILPEGMNSFEGFVYEDSYYVYGDEDYYDEGGEGEYYDEGYSVYIQAYDIDGLPMLSSEYVVHSTDVWSAFSLTTSAPIAALHIYGTMSFKIDSIQIQNTMNGQAAVTTPEPSSFLLLGVGLLAFLACRAGVRQR